MSHPYRQFPSGVERDVVSVVFAVHMIPLTVLKKDAVFTHETSHPSWVFAVASVTDDGFVSHHSTSRATMTASQRASAAHGPNSTFRNSANACTRCQRI